MVVYVLYIWKNENLKLIAYCREREQPSNYYQIIHIVAAGRMGRPPSLVTGASKNTLLVKAKSSLSEYHYD